MKTEFRTWVPLHSRHESFGAAELKALRNGSAPCVIIDDFCPEDVCSAIRENIERHGRARTYTGSNLDVGYWGVPAMEYVGRKDEYFTAVAGANEERQRLIGGQPDPLDSVLRMLWRAWPAGAEVATEGDRPYFAGIVRNIRKVPPHMDSAARDLPGWAVSRIAAQLSWNLYLSVPEVGGEFAIWPRYWRAEDEQVYRYAPAGQFGPDGKKGYRHDVVDGLQPVVVPPSVGRVIMLNTLYYHMVLDVEHQGSRYAMSSFIGIVDEESPLVLWC
jgi:hypothetical protein